MSTVFRIQVDAPPDDAENVVRDAIRKGMKATEAYARYGVL